MTPDRLRFTYLAMHLDIRDASLLRLKLSRSDNDRQPVSFLVGAPFSNDAGVGVPTVGGFLDVIRARVARSGPAFSRDLDRAIADGSRTQAYQRAMGFVYDALDAQAAADIVRAAVLQARRPGAPALDPLSGYDGVADDWAITRAQRGLAHAMALDPDRFSGPIFTTNFDPMVELALRDRGFAAKTTSIPLDGAISAPVKSSTTEVDVFHLHGYWRTSATLHRPQQLTLARPQLQQSLQRQLDGLHLVVMAYSGWDDIFTAAIANCLSDPQFRGTLSWCFYEPDPVIARAENEDLFRKFAPGIGQGRISFFCGIDCHTVFDDLTGTTAHAPPRLGTAGDPDVPGWHHVSAATIGGTPLTGAEAVRFFDGAVPTLRHAASALIPRLAPAEVLIATLEGAGGNGCGMQLLRGAGGEGKSTALLQAAVAAARSGSWAVLYRPTPGAGLSAEIVMKLDPARRWLIVADDAEGLVDDLWTIADRLHREGRRNVFFLLAARDTDWRRVQGDRPSWSSRLDRSPDVAIGRIGEADAGRVVDAWAAQGEPGLRLLSREPSRDARVRRFTRSMQAQDLRGGEGSFFGGLLDTRFGSAGLVDHLLALLGPLQEQPVSGGTTTLFGALVFIASCHSAEIGGLDNRILALLCGIPAYCVPSRVIAPLGREVGAAESHGLALTRHRRVADAIVVAAHRMGVDLHAVWRDIIFAAVKLSRSERVGETFGRIVHPGPRLQRKLPKALDEDLRGDIAIAAARASMEAMPDRAIAFTGLGRAYRSAGYPIDACAVFRQGVDELPKKVDRAETARPFFVEWSTCAGNLGTREGRIADAWLASCSLSDLLPGPLTFEQAKLACAGLGVAFEHLASGSPDDVYAKGRRAVTELGWKARPDHRATTYFTRYQRELDAQGTPTPGDMDETILWLQRAAEAAWRQLDDDRLRRLRPSGRLTFQALRHRLTGAAPRRKRRRDH